MRIVNRFTVTITLAGLAWAVVGLIIAAVWLATGSL